MPLNIDEPQGGLLTQPAPPQGGLLSFISSPVGQGLLSAAFSGLATAGRPGYGRWNTIGAAGLGGFKGYGAAQDAQREREALTIRGAQQQRLADQENRRWKFAQDLLNGGNGFPDGESGPAQWEPQSMSALDRPLSLGDGVVRTDPPSLPMFDFGASQQSRQPVYADVPGFTAAPGFQGGSQPSLLNGVPRQALAAELMFNDGKSLGEWMLKRGAPDMQVSNGYAYDKNTLQPGFVPGYAVSQDGKSTVTTIGADGLPKVSAPPGALDVYSGYREADERAKATYDTIQVWDPEQGRMVTVPRATVAGNQVKTQPRQPMPGQSVPSEWRTETVPPRGSDPATLAILEDELRKETDPRNQVALRQEIASVRSRPPYGGGALPAGPSDREKSATAAQGDINTRWLQSTYEPTIAAGDSASSMLANIQTARMGLRGVGTSGYGADARVAAASVLSALGVPQAEKVATSAALFQQAASTRLFEVLGAQKGPQTEGDAARAARTFASISNPDAANAYILDLAQAQAERDRMRASFYRDALPLAQREGDLSKVDREWSRIAPSVFNMPTMKRWAQQKGGK